MDLVKFLDEVDKVLWDKVWDIPLSNSDVQNIFLIVADDFSEARKARGYLLKLMDRKQVLENMLFELKKQVIHLKRLKKSLEGVDDELTKEEILLDIYKAERGLKSLQKLIYDCIREIYVLYEVAKKLPKYTREEFEKQEFEHFEKKLVSVLTEPDAVKSLKALGYDVRTDGRTLSLSLDPKSRQFLDSVLDSGRKLYDMLDLKSLTSDVEKSYSEIVSNVLGEMKQLIGDVEP